MIFLEFPMPALIRVFESNRIERGMTHDAPGGARLELGQMPIEKRTLPYVEPMVTVLVSFAGSVAANLFSTWLYEKLRSARVTTIRINQVEVEVTPEAITRVIARSVEIEQPR
jgi:hypothetical protein